MLQWAPECFGGPGDLKLAALAISEPEGGSDVRNLRTRGQRDGDDWIIEGHKMWIGNGGIANVHVANAVVDEELGHRGQALFIVPGGTPGLEMVRKLDKLGCRASHTAELKLNGVRVPADNLLGGQEKLERKLARAREAIEGGRHSGSATMGTFEQTRPMVAAQALGIARAAMEYATEYANRREAFGAPIIDNQGIAFPLADLATAIDAARLLTWRASWMAATGVPFERGEGSMSKLAASEVAVRTTERAIQTMGGWGYIKDHPVEKWYRDAKLYTCFRSGSICRARTSPSSWSRATRPATAPTRAALPTSRCRTVRGTWRGPITSRCTTPYRCATASASSTNGSMSSSTASGGNVRSRRGPEAATRVWVDHEHAPAPTR